MDKVIQSVEKLISRGTLGVHMFHLSHDKIEHMHTHGLHCEIKQCKIVFEMCSAWNSKTEWESSRDF